MTLWGLLAPARLCCSSSLRLTPVCCTAHHVTRRKHTWDRLPSAEAEEEATSASSIQPRQSRTDHLGIQFREFKERYRMLDQSSDVMAKDGITEVVEGARYGKYRFFEVHTAAKEVSYMQSYLQSLPSLEFLRNRQSTLEPQPGDPMQVQSLILSYGKMKRTKRNQEFYVHCESLASMVPSMSPIQCLRLLEVTSSIDAVCDGPSFKNGIRHVVTSLDVRSRVVFSKLTRQERIRWMDCMFSMDLVRGSNSFQLGVFQLAEEVSDLNNAELMYLMFSLVVKKQWLPERLSRDIDHETGRLFESKGVTLQEIGIICAAFFRCKQRLTSENFRRLVPHAVRFVPSAVDDPIPYTFLLKTLRYSANMNDWRQIRHLLEEALPFIPDMTTATCAHLARLCTAHVPISVPTVMEQVVNTLVSRLDPLLKQDRRGPPNDPIRIKDLEQMVQTLSCVGLPSRYLNQLIVQELLDNPNMIKGQEGRRVLSLANLLSALSHTEDCPVSLVRILMEEELEKIFFIPSVTVNYPDILRTVFELEQLGVIEFPDEPNLPRMPARLRELAVQKYCAIWKPNQKAKSYVDQCIMRVVSFLMAETGRPKSDFPIMYPLPHIALPMVVFYSDPAAKPPKSPKLGTIFRPSHQDGTLVCLWVPTRAFFSINNPVFPSAKIQLISRQLKKIGLHEVQLPARIGDDSKYPDSYLVRLFQDFLPSETFDQTPAIHNISKKKELAAKVWD